MWLDGRTVDTDPLQAMQTRPLVTTDRQMEGGMMKRIIVAVSVFVLASCSYIPQRYSVSADNTKALLKLRAGHVNVGPFSKTADFDNSCRAVAGVVEEPDSAGFEGYIQKALVEELKQAGMFDDQAPTITLSGVVEKLSLTAQRSVYISRWDIGVRLKSSNGNSVYITQRYEFNAGPQFLPDCQIIADQYMVAVQKTLGKLIDAPEFQSLVTP